MQEYQELTELTWVGHPPGGVAEGIPEAVPVQDRDLVGPHSVGAGPVAGGGRVHLPDGVEVCLVAQDNDGELWVQSYGGEGGEGGGGGGGGE